MSGIRRRRGAALLLCMVFSALVLASVTMLSIRVAGHIRHSQYASWRTAAFSTADGILNQIASELGRSAAMDYGFTGDADQLIRGLVPLPRIDDRVVSPQAVPGTPVAHWYALVGSAPTEKMEVVIVVVVAEVQGVYAVVEGSYQGLPGLGPLNRITWRERNFSPGVPGNG